MSDHEHSVSRELALKVLYQIDLHNVDRPEDVRRLLEEGVASLEPRDDDSSSGEPLEASRRRAIEAYARTLVHGVVGGLTRFDRAIGGIADNWELHRMAAIDRNVLRIGAYELLDRPSIPRAVAINEAIELARKFSTRDSGTFVNGILDKLQTHEADA